MEIHSENQIKQKSKTPLQKYLIRQFHSKKFLLIDRSNIYHIHDKVCGVGFWVNALNK